MSISTPQKVVASLAGRKCFFDGCRARHSLTAPAIVLGEDLFMVERRHSLLGVATIGGLGDDRFPFRPRTRLSLSSSPERVMPIIALSNCPKLVRGLAAAGYSEEPRSVISLNAPARRKGVTESEEKSGLAVERAASVRVSISLPFSFRSRASLARMSGRRRP